MYQKALSTYYGLSMFVLGTAAFVFYPSGSSEFANWQQDVQSRVAIAWVEVVGDQPWFEEFDLIVDGVESFYEQSALAMIDLFQSSESDEDIYFVFNQVYNSLAAAITMQGPKTASINYEEIVLPPLPTNFMQEESLYNLVPYKTIVKTINEPEVAGAAVSWDKPANSKTNPWVTLKDNLTGQLYCLALFNGEVNQYLGPCKYDYD